MKKRAKKRRPIVVVLDGRSGASPVTNDDDGMYDPPDVTDQKAEQRREAARKREKQFQSSLSRNPIVAAIQSAIHERHLHVSIQFRNDESRVECGEFIDKTFGIKVQEQLGKMLLTAMCYRDTEFPKIVAKAIKQSDPVFNRHREATLRERVTSYVWSLPEPLPPMDQLKAAVERKYNNGKKLSAYRWQRLCHASLISSPRGRPLKKSNTKTG